MLSSLRLHNFKKHKDSRFEFERMNFIYWPNGSWKTNILESIYILLNSKPYFNTKLSDEVSFFCSEMMISWMIDSALPLNGKVTYDLQSDRTWYIVDTTRFTRAKYLEKLGHIALFFAPQEMNIMYLWPSLRRDFLDEIIFLWDNSFAKVKSDYQKILKNRNSLLKRIWEWKASKPDLNFWDKSFIDASVRYYSFRKNLIDFISSNMHKIESMLESKYKLSFNYETKIDFSDIEGSIKNYLHKNVDRDIMLWYTYIWPHIDDFSFQIEANWSLKNTAEYLSRWENKSILLALKFLEIEYFGLHSDREVIVLLDDVFSELDDWHIALVLQNSAKFQTFITAQNLPQFIDNDAEIKKIFIN